MAPCLGSRRAWVVEAIGKPVLEELAGLLDAATALAGDEIVRRRIELSRFSLEYTTMMLELFAVLNNCERPDASSPPARISCDRARKLKQQIVAAMDSGRWGLAVAPSKTFDYFWNAMDAMIDRWEGDHEEAGLGGK